MNRRLPVLVASVVSLSLLAVDGSAAAPIGATQPTARSVSSQALPDDAYDTPADLGFHDASADGSPRALRNDLQGSLAGQVEFAQSSTVNPSGNDRIEMPTLVSRRDALLLFSPISDVQQVQVEATLDGRPLGTLSLAHPHALPQWDQSVTAGRQTVQYSRRAWSVRLPWSWVQPGLELTFTAGGGARGTLPASAIEMAAPHELIINNIELGMLTDAPTSSGHRMLEQPASAAADYFQTIPVSRMVMARYDQVRLDRVIVASGNIYETPGSSATSGDVYSGDMRENVAKAQVATGINLANFGNTSGPMTQRQPGTFNQRIIHHAAGVYTNGRVTHGLSGGNGMATLHNSVGNELSHELGHSYGLGHYPGTDNSAVGDARIINATHHADSGWGWIAYRNRMRSNLSAGDYRPDGVDINGNRFRQTFGGQYNFNTDAMAGGWDASNLSDYTHHTGYSARRIQRSLRNVVPDTSFPSGYRSWDSTQGEYVDARTVTPALDAARPAQVGVPVFTLLGGYNPANPAQTVLYPAFRSNYGNTFALPAPDLADPAPARRCWVEITHQDGRVTRVTLAAEDGVKQLNVNVAQSDRPTRARVLCRTSGTTTPLGEAITIRTDLPPMEPAVVIGQEAGYEALRSVELAALAPKLEALAGQAVPVLAPGDALKLLSWQDDLSQLSPVAREVARRHIDALRAARRVERFLNQYDDELAAGDLDRRRQLAAILREEGMPLDRDTFLPRGSQVKVDGGKCLHLDGSQAKVTTNGAGCVDSAAFRWFVDARGALHSLDRPELCMTPGSPVGMSACDPSDPAQSWAVEDTGIVARSTAAGSVLDLNRSTHRPIVYGRTGGSNQIWKQFQADRGAVLAGLSSRGLAALFRLELDNLPEPEEPVTANPPPTGPAPQPPAASPSPTPGTQPASQALRTRTTVRARKVARGVRVRVAVRATAAVTGRAVITVRRVKARRASYRKTVSLRPASTSTTAKASRTVPARLIPGPGRYVVTVRYLGTSSLRRSTARTRVLVR